MSGCLYVVATPIGHLDDITIRALSTLKSVALIAAEDTRRTGNLLRHFGIATPTTSLHAHNEKPKTAQLLRRLAAGADIALVSDAGTPLLSDPGHRLVASIAAAGIKVVPIPGPSAIAAALSVAGLPSDRFRFAGFAPNRSSDRKIWLESIDAHHETTVAFEAPHRIVGLLQELRRFSVDRPMVLCRELTKLHEQIVRTTTHEAHLIGVEPRGEFTVVFAAVGGLGDASRDVSDEALLSFYGQLTYLDAKTPRLRMAITAKRFGLSTNEVYERLSRKRQQGSS